MNDSMSPGPVPKLGLLVGFEDSLGTVVEVARQAEAAGFDSVYTVEAGRTAFVTAAAVISATEHIQVGTYVVNAYAHEPWVTGLAARDLDEMSGGRFTLGVGTGNRHFNDWYMGIDSSRPWAKMRDYINIVRAVAAGTPAEGVRYAGDEHRLRWRASYEPARPTVPVYLSASGPKMLKVAGETADGVAVGVMSSTKFLSDIVRPIASDAATAAGRDPAMLAYPMGAQVCLHADQEVARDAARATICGLYHPVPHPYYDSQLRQLGFSDFADQAAELMPAGRTREAMELVPDEVIDTMTITGTADDCLGRINDYTGFADEIIALRVSVRGEASGVAAYEDLFELGSRHAANRA